MKVDKYKAKVELRGEDGERLSVYYDNRGEPYNQGITFLFVNDRLLNNDQAIWLYLEKNEALKLSDLINQLYSPSPKVIIKKELKKKSKKKLKMTLKELFKVNLRIETNIYKFIEILPEIEIQELISKKFAITMRDILKNHTTKEWLEKYPKFFKCLTISFYERTNSLFTSIDVKNKEPRWPQ